MKALFVIAVCLIPTFLFAQVDFKKIDSIRQAIRNSSDNKTIIEGYIDLSAEFANQDSSLFYCNQALRISRQTNYQIGIAQSLADLGRTYDRTGNKEKALQNY